MAVTVGNAWKSSVPVSTTRLVEKVTRLYGLSGDSDAEALALDALDDTTKEFNMQVWEFNIVEASGLAMTANTRTVTLPTLFYKEKVAYLVNTSDSRKHDPLHYLDWATFERLYAPEPNSLAADPEVYSVQNQHREGLVYLGPTPSTATATDKTLTIQYYRRIELPSTVPNLNVPQEVEVALLYGAKKRFAIEIAGPSAEDWQTFELLESKAFERLQAIDRRHPDEATRFRISDRFRGRKRAGGVYVRLD